MRHLKVIILCLSLVATDRMIAQNPPPPCGTPGVPSTYVDTLNGVIAYSNDDSGPIGCYDPNAFEWECVEFIERYYSQRFGISLGSIPTAAQAFSLLQENSQFLAFAQESTTIPQAEDIIVFGTNLSTPFGHVAIVKANPILQSDGSYQIPIIEQNSYLTHVLVMQGNAIVGFTITGRSGLQHTAPIIGWVRKASSSSSNPVPSISQLQPNSLLAGSATQILTINGTGFLTTSTVTFNGIAHTSTYVNARQLTISLSTSDLETVGSYPVVVTNPTPGGGTSGAVNFTVSATPPSGAGQWTWMGGSNTVPPCSSIGGNPCGQPGVYGTLGTPASGNIPGGRDSSSSWIDSSGHLWLFGGFGYDSSPSLNWGKLNDLWEFSTPTNQWTWMSGSNAVSPGGGQPGVYGTLGTPASGNTPGGRMFAVSWTDSSGHFWLFGGYGPDANLDWDSLNDLWEFNPFANDWTWMGGSSIYTCSWDACAPPGVYGTLGKPAAGNTPGGRISTVSWTDSSNHLWLFGGGAPAGALNYDSLNDLWEFNPSTNEWAWIDGGGTMGCITSYACGQSGVYGTLGVPASENVPGGRQAAVSWTDTSGHLWLFGGYGPDASHNWGQLNDLWEFDASTNQWIWMSGSSMVGSKGGQPGVYGTLGKPAADNVPGGRQGAMSWTDSSGNFWLFGGEGYDTNGTIGLLNDLWRYQP
jgi:N-acetylneuraminic acid mutarotase